MKCSKKMTICLLLLLQCFMFVKNSALAGTSKESRVMVESRGWQLIGDLCLPASEEPCPAVLMLNKAAGNRQVYTKLAGQLAARGMASLRLDLPGHGESTNLGRFIPYETDSLNREIMIWESDIEVTAAHQFLKDHPRIDANKIGIIGGSYSGEEMAEAGRMRGYAQAYVELSPGSFSDESIQTIDASGLPWLFIVSKQDRHLKKIAAAVQAKSKTVELLIIPGTEHATQILDTRVDMAERIAVWLAHQLR